MEKTLPPSAARRLYDLIGRAYDLAGAFEGHGQHLGSQKLQLNPGLRTLEIGVGTGRQHRQLAQAVQPGGLAVGLDLSFVMARLTRRRTGSPVCQASAVSLPFAPQTFDRVYAAYILDLMAPADLPRALAEFRRCLRPGGRLVVVTMTEGVDFGSRAFVGLWKAVYALSPTLCAGCRPLKLARLAVETGFDPVDTQVVVDWTVPSEVLTAVRA
jgi:ubiquinone/menaquinone biosynthesis C-methylase UbiE